MGFSFDKLIWCGFIGFGLQCLFIGSRIRHQRAFVFFGLALLFLSGALLTEGQPIPQVSLFKNSLGWNFLSSSFAILSSILLLRLTFDVTHPRKTQLYTQSAISGLALILLLMLIWILGSFSIPVFGLSTIFFQMMTSILSTGFLFLTILIDLFFLGAYLKNPNSKNLPQYFLLTFGYIILGLGFTSQLKPGFALLRAFSPLENHSARLWATGLFAVIGTTFLMERFLSIYRANKKALDQLAAAYDSLNESTRLKQIGASTSVITHEIRNYAATIKGNATLLNRKKSSEETFAEVNRIKSTAERMEKVSKDVATFATSSIPINKKSIQLDEFISKIISLCFNTYQGFFKVTAFQNLPFINADEEKLEHVFINLFRNALEADAQKIEIRFQHFRSKLIVVVEDDGIGADTETLLKMTTPFFSTKGQQGTGLGCSIAESIVSAHAGSLRCYSKNLISTVKTGLVFNLLFPTENESAKPHSKMKFHFWGREEEVKKDLIQPLQNLGLDRDFIDPNAYTPNLAGAKGREFLIVGPDDFKTYANKLKPHRGIIVIEDRVGRFFYPGLKVESSAVLFCEEMIAKVLLENEF